MALVRAMAERSSAQAFLALKCSTKLTEEGKGGHYGSSSPTPSGKSCPRVASLITVFVIFSKMAQAICHMGGRDIINEFGDVSSKVNLYLGAFQMSYY